MTDSINQNEIKENIIEEDQEINESQLTETEIVGDYYFFFYLPKRLKNPSNTRKLFSRRKI